MHEFNFLNIYIYFRKAAFLILDWNSYTWNNIWLYYLLNSYLIFLICFSWGITNMLQVTIPHVSPNNLQIHLSVWIPYLRHYNIGISAIQDLALNSTLQDQKSVYQDGELDWLWTDTEIFHEVSGNRDEKNLFIVSLRILKKTKFVEFVELVTVFGLIYTTTFFMKGMIHSLLVLFFPTLIFLKILYFQRNKKDILDNLEIEIFFAAEPRWLDRILNDFLKFIWWMLLFFWYI